MSLFVTFSFHVMFYRIFVDLCYICFSFVKLSKAIISHICLLLKQKHLIPCTGGNDTKTLSLRCIQNKVRKLLLFFGGWSCYHFIFMRNLLRNLKNLLKRWKFIRFEHLKSFYTLFLVGFSLIRLEMKIWKFNLCHFKFLF